MRADAALARLRDVSHRPASHRCSARRNAPSRSPTLPTRRDLRATANGFAQVLVAPAGDGVAVPAVPAIEIEFVGSACVRIPASVSPALAAAVVEVLARR